jgi:two-component system nitrate/nitrite response regulator NarL
MERIIKIFIADDHPIVRKGLKEILLEQPNIQCVGEAENGLQALEDVIRLEPDLAILDIDMPIMNGLDVAKKAISKNLFTRFIILTMHREEGFYNEAMDIGARGYLLKDAVLNDLVDCIHTVQKGGTYVSPTLENFLEKREAKKLTSDWARNYDLTLSELNVLKLVSEGKTTREIAETLFVSEKTIETHRGNCVKKLGLEGGKNALMKFLLENKGIF